MIDEVIGERACYQFRKRGARKSSRLTPDGSAARLASGPSVAKKPSTPPGPSVSPGLVAAMGTISTREFHLGQGPVLRT
jgi:hypothetical protein